MRRAARRRMTFWIVIAHVLASAGVGVAAVAISGGSGASGAFDLTLAAAAAKPPPVVDGVRRVNVGSPHSPRLSHALSGGPVKASGALPRIAGARGIDVASNQHPHGEVIHWGQVARAGYRFAFVKASEGNYYANPYYPSDMARAQTAGLYVTGYHFAIPNVSSGASQAKFAERHARYDGRTVPLALDIEYNPYGATCYGFTAARMVAWISAFTAEARRLTGQLPVIYTTADWWRTCTGDSRAFRSDSLWVAAYGPASPPMPAGWRRWTFWQYTSRGQVPGVAAQVDVSYFRRSAVRLMAPGPLRSVPGTAIRLQVKSLNAAGQAPVFIAAGLPRGLTISARGRITGTIAASATGEHSVRVSALTPSGVTGSVRFTWTVRRRAPAAPLRTPRRNARSRR